MCFLHITGTTIRLNPLFSHRHVTSRKDTFLCSTIFTKKAIHLDPFNVRNIFRSKSITYVCQLLITMKPAPRVELSILRRQRQNLTLALQESFGPFDGNHSLLINGQPNMKSLIPIGSKSFVSLIVLQTERRNGNGKAREVQFRSLLEIARNGFKARWTWSPQMAEMILCTWEILSAVLSWYQLC